MTEQVVRYPSSRTPTPFTESSSSNFITNPTPSSCSNNGWGVDWSNLGSETNHVPSFPIYSSSNPVSKQTISLNEPTTLGSTLTNSNFDQLLSKIDYFASNQHTTTQGRNLPPTVVPNSSSTLNDPSFNRSESSTYPQMSRSNSLGPPSVNRNYSSNEQIPTMVFSPNNPTPQPLQQQENMYHIPSQYSTEDERMRSRSVTFTPNIPSTGSASSMKPLPPVPGSKAASPFNNSNKRGSTDINRSFNVSPMDENFNSRATISFDISVQPNSTQRLDAQVEDTSRSSQKSFAFGSETQSYFSNFGHNDQNHNFEAIMSRQSFVAPRYMDAMPPEYVDEPVMYSKIALDPIDLDTSSQYNPNAVTGHTHSASISEFEEDEAEDVQKLYDIIQLCLLDPPEFQQLCDSTCKLLDSLVKGLTKLPTDCTLQQLEKYASLHLKSLSNFSSKEISKELVSLLLDHLHRENNKQTISAIEEKGENNSTSIGNIIRQVGRECLLNLRQDVDMNKTKLNDSDQEVNTSLAELDLIPRQMVKDKKGIERFLQQSNGDSNVLLNDFGDTLTHACCYYGYRSSLEFLHKEKGANLSLRNKEGKLPLEYAIQHHNVSCAIYLIGNNMSVHLLANERFRSLLLRDFMGEKKKRLPKSLYECIHESSKIKANTKDEFGMTPLHYVAMFRMEGALKKLFESDQLRVNERDKLKRAPIHLAAVTNNLDIIDRLCKKAEIDRKAQDENGESFLHYYMRFFYSVENGPRYENPIVLLHRIQTQYKWFRSPIVDTGLILAHAGAIDKQKSYHEFVISCWNQIVKFGMSESYIIVDNQYLEGIVDAETVKFCIVSCFNQFIIPPKRNQKRPYRMYMGIGLDTILRKKGILPGSQNKDSNYYLKIRSYGTPNKNEKQFREIVEKGGRIFYVNGKSVRQCVQTMNSYLIDAVYKGDATKAKKDPRWDCGAQIEMKRTSTVEIKYGKTIKQLYTTTINYQVVDVSNLKTYSFSAIDWKDLQFLFTDIQNFPEDATAAWITNNSKQTPLGLALSLIRSLVKINKIEQNSIVTLPVTAFKQ